MFNDAQKSYNEHIRLSGDKSKANQYLPFARSKVNFLFSLSKEMDGTPLNKYFKVGNVDIHVKVVGEHKYIDINSPVIQEGETCGTYVSGLFRVCQAVSNTTTLKEFYPKDGDKWENLAGYSIPSPSFITDLGFPQGGKTQHAYIKSGNYTGFMRYAIQNLLGQNKQIGFKYGFKETDGIIVEDIIPKEIIDNANLDVYFIQDVVDLRYIKISEKGVFIKKAEHCLPADIKINKDNPGLIDTANRIEENSFEPFQSLLKLSSFTIPEELENSGTTMLISEEGMSEFYQDKTPLFNSCGWLIPSQQSFDETTEDSRGETRTRIYGIFNTCQDETKSYLYGIKLVQKRVVFSDSFKLSEEYLTNDKYKNSPNSIYEYEATLHKLLEGEMSSPKLSYDWLNSESNLYVPSEEIDCIVKYNKIVEAGTEDELAPMYVFDDGTNWNVIGEFNLSTVAMMNIFSNADEQDSLIQKIDKDLINYFGLNFISNNQLGRFKIIINNDDFYCHSYTHTGGVAEDLTNEDKDTKFETGYDNLYQKFKKTFTSTEISDYTEDGVRSISRKLVFTNLNHTNEKILIPLYNRNSVITLYSGNSNKEEMESAEFIYDYKDGQPLQVISPFLKTVDGYSQYEIVNFVLDEDGNWINDGYFNIKDFLSPYILFYYKDMITHYMNSEVSLYKLGKYFQLNKGCDYDSNYDYRLEAKDWVADYIEYYIQLGKIFSIELILDVFSTNCVFNLAFEEGLAYVASIYGYPDETSYSYINFVGRP